MSMTPERVYWRTQETYIYDKKWKQTVCLAGMIKSKVMPNTEIITKGEMDIYYDYFISQNKALQHVNFRRSEGFASGVMIKPCLSEYK